MIAGEDPPGRGGQAPSARPPAPAAPNRLAAIARAELHRRRRRGELIGSGLFADPAWDILLLLYIREQEGRLTDVEALRQAADIAPTTLLRWIGLLAETGTIICVLIRGTPDMFRVRLSDRGLAGMEQYLEDGGGRNERSDR